MNHLFVTFEDTTGVTKEIDVTAQRIRGDFGDMSEDEIIQAWVNSGMKVISTRYGAPDSIPAPVPPVPGVGCLLSILSIFGF